MDKESKFLVFTLEGHRFGLALAEVVRVYPAVALAELEAGPEILLGLFKVAGNNIPVLDLRLRLRLPSREVVPDDALVVASSPEGEIAFFVDAVVGVYTFADEELRASGSIYPEMAAYVTWVGELEGHTVWIYTLERLFAEQDFAALIEVATSPK
ncbi:MAG: chemotaxis protein CheW [Deltaproteobacteria bacterium]|nr:chemotaxis protein CheW [Deltaproteobacteria bacterium]